MKKIQILCAAALAVLGVGCGVRPEVRPLLIPEPCAVDWTDGVCRLPADPVIGVGDPALADVAGYLGKVLLPHAETVRAQPSGKADIALGLDTVSLAAEAYRLEVRCDGVRIEGGSPRGVANGIATLRQLLPAATGAGAELPCVEIEDAPAFAWRGVMLDVSRHFFDKEEILTLLDRMARLKLNKFHWHLTDDQGWRVEIARYPELTERGGWRRLNGQDRQCLAKAAAEADDDLLLPAERLRVERGDTLYGGFYTRAEIREVVAYAAARGIDVIPEIDMPGHFMQAVDCYPHLTCFPRPWDGGGFSTPLCVGSDRAIAFCEEVWEELFELFPYEYVHLGGDEVNTSDWMRCPRCRARMRAEGLEDGAALQAWFTARMQRFLAAHGRKMIGWDEILEGGVDSSATVMWWRPWEPQTVSRATRQGGEVILCPQTWWYFSLGEDREVLPRVCSFEMLPDSLPAEQRALVKGVQANVWTETIPTWSRVEYKLYPRLALLSEKGWRQPGPMDAERELARLLRYCGELDREGINYRIPSLEGYHDLNVFADSVRTTFRCPLPQAVLRYTLDGSVPTLASPRYEEPLTIRSSCTLCVRPFHEDGRTGDWTTMRYEKREYGPVFAPRRTRPGVEVAWYFDRFPCCDAIGGERPDGVRSVERIAFPEEASGRRAVGMIFRGLLAVPHNGIYTFALRSDDGAVLRIGERVIIDNEGEHPALTRSGQAMLSEGLHPFELRYFDYNGGEVDLWLVDSEGNRREIDGEWLRTALE